MEAVRQSWTDERLDDFRKETARRLDKVDADVRELRGAMTAGFERVDARIDALNQTILRLGGGALITFVVGFVGLIATQL
jgi:hypothetical protein